MSLKDGKSNEIHTYLLSYFLIITSQFLPILFNSDIMSSNNETFEMKKKKE